MSDYAVIARDVVKTFSGVNVLQGITLRVPRGSVYIIAGPNGSGKTTTVRVLLGLYRRDGGEVRVLGCDPLTSCWRSVVWRIGYLPEDASPYERLSGYENIVFYAKLYASRKDYTVEELVERAVELSGLSPRVLEKKTGEYSKGMKRRLLLALSLMHDPELAILDEPTSGLDVYSSHKVRETIRELRDEGKTIILTTHNLLEAELIADMIAFISRGRIVFEGDVREALEIYESSNLEEAFIKATSPQES